MINKRTPDNHRVDDLHRTHSRGQREELAKRHHGTALVPAGMIEARTQSRRVNGHLRLPALRTALEAHVAAQTVSVTRHDEPMIAA